MKNFGITDKEKQLLFVVLALAVLALSYFFGFTKLQDQTATIKASNVQDQTTVDNLRNMVSRQAETEQETERYKQTIKDVVAKYPSDVPQEKAIYQVQEMEDATGVHVDSVNFSMNNLVMNFSGENAPSGRYNTMGMHFSSSYDQFKEMLKLLEITLTDVRHHLYRLSLISPRERLPVRSITRPFSLPIPRRNTKRFLRPESRAV